jgi:hypothetical protein
MISVAEAAPATAVTTVLTYLRRSLRQFANGSRPPTPEGSRPAFAWGDVATPVRSIIDRPSLTPSSSTRSPIGSPCGALSLAGGLRAYHVPPMYQSGLGRVSTPVARQLRRRSSETPDLATCLLAQAYQQLALVLCDDASNASPGLTLPLDPGSRPPCCWQSQLRLAPGLPSMRRRLRCAGSFVQGRYRRCTSR